MVGASLFAEIILFLSLFFLSFFVSSFSLLTFLPSYLLHFLLCSPLLSAMWPYERPTRASGINPPSSSSTRRMKRSSSLRLPLSHSRRSTNQGRNGTQRPKPTSIIETSQLRRFPRTALSHACHFGISCRGVGKSFRQLWSRSCEPPVNH